MSRPTAALFLPLALAGLLCGCAHAPTSEAAKDPAFTNIGYATWREDEPDYRLYPGDVLDVAIPSAPELNRTVTVQPDGRIALPLIPPVMAADRSVPELETALGQAYAGQLLSPIVQVSVKSPTALKVFVGGEVDKPGVYDMPGDIDALQAVVMAGGFRPLALRRDVVIIRRGPGGRPMMRRVNLSRAIYSAPNADAVPLRRFDIIYVPRTPLANLDVLMQGIRDALPVQFSYAINGQYIAAP